MRHSVLTRDLTHRNIIEVVGQKKTADKILTVAETSSQIAKIYAAKMNADDQLSERLKNDPTALGDRFDAFVMKSFRNSHPTRQAARRHMKIFLRSVRNHAEEHPRIEMFRKLCGVPNLDHEVVAFVPGLVNK